MYNVCMSLKKVLWSEESCKLSTGMWSCSYRRKRKAGHIVKSIYVMIKKTQFAQNEIYTGHPFLFVKCEKKTDYHRAYQLFMKLEETKREK